MVVLPHLILNLLCIYLLCKILPKLQSEVDLWDPLTDTVPIHSWIHPWLPLMGARLQPLFAPIRHKLAAALTNWHASDVSGELLDSIDMLFDPCFFPTLICKIFMNPRSQRSLFWNRGERFSTRENFKPSWFDRSCPSCTPRSRS